MMEESFFFLIIFTELYISIHSAPFHSPPLQPSPMGLTKKNDFYKWYMVIAKTSWSVLVNWASYGLYTMILYACHT